MKAVVMERYGTPDVLELRDVATPTPEANEVLVRVRAASINDWDWAMVQGAPFGRDVAVDMATPPPYCQEAWRPRPPTATRGRRAASPYER